ncbi:MAG: hypothetical protein JOZ15_02285 [Acidobacteria bacterium]|nr:hypothetical protein [Acidobacteriota bacterium]
MSKLSQLAVASLLLPPSLICLTGREAAAAQMTNGNSPAMLGRGYHARACGFDLNHNGIFGEPADCHVCDGVTTNPYGDSDPPNMVYVSCQTGADNPTCGSPGNPCATINYAWNYRTAPPASPSADIICFRGTCHEDSISPGVSGKGGFYTIPASGSQAISWQLPAHPTMLVGWDYNQNGQYPPYDTQDVAVLEGTGLAQALLLNGNQINSDVELAHFTVANYGTGVNANPTGFIELSDGASGSSHHIYIHDISIQNVNQGKALDSGNIIFDFFGSNAQISYLAVQNVEIRNAGGYVARGAAPSGPPDNGPYRFQNITWTALGCNASGAGACADPANQAHAIGWKLWGYVDGIEVLDSVLNLNTAAWTPYPIAFGSTAFVAAQCSRNWTIRNNEIDDFKVGLAVQGYAQGYCDGAAARPVDGVTFDRNTFRNTYTLWQWGDNGVVFMGGGPTPQSSIGSVLVSNNFFSSAPGWQGMAYINAGNSGGPDPGAFTFANNTTISNLYRTDFGAITLQANYGFVPQALTVTNNVIGGLAGGEQNIHTDYAPAAWNAGGNVFDPNGVFAWNGAQLGSLAAWQAATLHDTTSRQCVPSFVNASGGDFHLVTTDACAKGAGLLLNNLFTWDIDGDPRPLVAPWDAGAHELSVPTLPPVATHFYTLTPCRVLDTRTTGGHLTGNTPSLYEIAGLCGVPTAATAVAFNVTAVSATAAVDLQLYPGDQPAPGTNAVSADPSRPVRAGAAVIALAAAGAGTVAVLPTFHTPGQVDLVLDVSGYYAP